MATQRLAPGPTLALGPGTPPVCSVEPRARGGPSQQLAGEAAAAHAPCPSAHISKENTFRVAMGMKGACTHSHTGRWTGRGGSQTETSLFLVIQATVTPSGHTHVHRASLSHQQPRGSHVSGAGVRHHTLPASAPPHQPCTHPCFRAGGGAREACAHAAPAIRDAMPSSWNVCRQMVCRGCAPHHEGGQGHFGRRWPRSRP